MWRISRPVLADVFLAVVLTALTVATLTGQPTDVGAAEVVLAMASVAPLALRQVWPVATMTVIIVAVAAAGLVGEDSLPSGGVGILVAMFTVATLRPRRIAVLMFAAACVCLALVLLPVEDVLWSQAAQSVLVVLGAWVLGESTRRWSERTRQAAAETATAVAEERVRIARELHDVVAHHMSVVSLQAGVAEYVLDEDPAGSRRAMTAVSDSAHDALAEMRRLLDVLHPAAGEDDTALSPQPGLADLPALVDRTAAAGVEVTTTVTGTSQPLSQGEDLCAYRVVQESVTNVLKHSRASRVDVDLIYETGWFCVRIADPGGPRGRRTGTVAGHGIRGMRERAELYGGTLDAAPVDSGFRVLLRLPLRAASEAAR